MTDFIIRPHGRLHDWIAHEKGYFTEEGLRYQLVSDEARENRLKEVDPATGALREIRSGAYEMYEQGSGSKGETHSDINCAIVRKFRQNGVEIPFPQRDLHVRSPLTLPFSPAPELPRST